MPRTMFEQTRKRAITPAPPAAIMAGRTNDRVRSLLFSLFAGHAARETGDYPPGRLNEKYRGSDLSRRFARLANFPRRIRADRSIVPFNVLSTKIYQMHDAWVLEFIYLFIWNLTRRCPVIQKNERKS